MTIKTTRHDPRYTTSNDRDAVLRAWGGQDRQSLTMDMGGWLDDDEVAFREAIQDDAREMGGSDLPCIVIERIDREQA